MNITIQQERPRKWKPVRAVNVLARIVPVQIVPMEIVATAAAQIAQAVAIRSKNSFYNGQTLSVSGRVCFF